METPKPTYEEMEQLVVELRRRLGGNGGKTSETQPLPDRTNPGEVDFGKFIDSIEDGISILSPDMTILRVNDVMRKWYKDFLPLEGRKCHHIYHGKEDVCEPCSTADAMSTGKTHKRIALLPESADADWIEIFSFPVIDDKTGEATAVVEIARNITAHIEAEKALKESESKWRALSENSPDHVMLLDRDGKILFINRGIPELTDQELIGRLAYDFLPATSADTLRSALHRVWETKLPAAIEFETETKEGRRNVNGRIAPIIKDGAVAEALGTITDVTRQKRAEKERREIEEKFRLAMEATNDGLWDWNISTGEVFYSPRWCRILGFEPNEVEYNYKFWKNRIHPDVRAKTFADLKEHLEGATPGFRQEVLMQTKSGRWLWITGRGRVVKRAEDGTPLRAIGTITDISERKAGEAALRESEEKYRHLFDAESDAILVSDMETKKIIDANEAALKLYGYEKDELLDMTVIDISAEPEKTAKSMNNCLEGNFEWVPIRRHRKKNGAEFLVEISPSQFMLKGRRAICGIIRDITKRVQAEEEQKDLQKQLLQSQKMEAIGQLAGGVAHDFNNMLAIIMGNAHLGLMEMKEGETGYKELSEIKDASERAKDLTMKMLTFARKDRMEMRPLQINSAIKELTGMLQRSFDKKIQIETALDDGIPAIQGDYNQIYQALMNICSNARDAMPNGGVLRIETRREKIGDRRPTNLQIVSPDGCCLVRISDTGTGMDEETARKIFEPFFTTKGVGQGTGLGMSVTHGIIERHGGGILCSSRPGAGTAIDIFLPFASLMAEGEKDKMDIELKIGAGGILIVDDEPQALRYTRKALEAAGYKAYTAGGGAKALEIYKEWGERIDLVLLDLIMPDMDGAETFHALKAINPNVRVTLCSGYSQDGMASELMEQGARHFIQKPFDLKMLTETIARAMQDD